MWCKQARLRRRLRQRLYRIWTGEFGAKGTGLLLAIGAGLSKRGERMCAWHCRNSRRLKRVEAGHAPFRSAPYPEPLHWTELKVNET